MTEQLRLFLVALQFYTRIPVTGAVARFADFTPQRLAHGTRWFTLVGGLVGLVTAVVFAAASLVLPQSVAVLLAMAGGLLTTGAFHEDGFADFCDGFGTHSDRERTLAIMRDSRIGTYGAVGIAMLLAGRFETLSLLDPSWVGMALVSSAMGSRACAVLVMVSLPYARDEADAKAKPIAVGVRRSDATIAVGLAMAVIGWIASWTGEWLAFGWAVGLGLAVTAWLRRGMRRRLGGYTGDCLGAVQQAAELAMLLGLLAVLYAAGAGVGDAIVVDPAPDADH